MQYKLNGFDTWLSETQSYSRNVNGPLMLRPDFFICIITLGLFFFI